MEKFSVGDALSYGWEAFKENVAILVSIILVVGFISSIPNIYSSFMGEESIQSPVFIILFLAVQLFTMFMYCGIVKVLLDIYDGREARFSDIFTNAGPFVSYLVASILVGIIVLVGLIFLIIPGIYLSLRLSLYGYVVVDEGLGPIDAIKRTWEITDGQALNLFILGLAMIGVVLAGIIALCMGLFVAIPVVMMAMVYVYRQLQSKAGMAY